MGQQQSTSEEGSQSDDWWTRESTVSSGSLSPTMSTSGSGGSVSPKSKSLPPMNHMRALASVSERQTLVVFDEPGVVRPSATLTQAEPTRLHSVLENGSAAVRARARLSSNERPVPAHAPELRSITPHGRSSLDDRQHALRRGRRVIRRGGRSEDSDSPGPSATKLSRGDSRRKVSFRAMHCMHYDLVLDRTATIRRGRNGAVNRSGKLTLITTRMALQRVAGRPPSLSENGGHGGDDIVVEDVMVRVNAYNRESGRELMWVRMDGTALEGYIDVQLKLNNPIHVLHLGESSIQQGPRMASLKVMYFANCHRTLLISSDTTVAELIEQLIAAYRVVDQPSNFALHECRKGKQFIGRSLDDEERPLLLSLLWGAHSNRSLELREVQPAVRNSHAVHNSHAGSIDLGSDSGIASSAASTLASVRSPSSSLPDDAPPEPVKSDAPKASHSTSTINWNDFVVPELDNFLRMLAREEEKQLALIESRYEKKRHALLEEMHDLAKRGLADTESPYGTLV